MSRLVKFHFEPECEVWVRQKTWMCSRGQNAREQPVLKIKTQGQGGFALSEASMGFWYLFYYSGVGN